MANQLKTMQEALARARADGKQHLQESEDRSRSIQDRLTMQRDATASEAKQALSRTAQLEDLASTWALVT